MATRTRGDRLWGGFDRFLLVISAIATLVAAAYGKLAFDQSQPAPPQRAVPATPVAARSPIVLTPTFLALIYGASAVTLAGVAIAHMRHRRTAAGTAAVSGAVGEALGSDTKGAPSTVAARTATETQFLRGRRWYTFWASPPFSFHQAKRRLEFIESWEKFFRNREALISYEPLRDAGKYIVENAVDYAIRDEPDAIYALATTHHHLSEMIVVALAKMKDAPTDHQASTSPTRAP